MKIQAILVIFLFLAVGTCFQEVHDEANLFAFYEKNSFKPILHAYYNRHFKKSPQFKQFEEVIDELYHDHSDYMQFLFTDCDQDTNLQLRTCESMNKTKDNRRIVGTFPSSDFRRIGDKIIQNPPSTQMLQHNRDVYSYSQLKEFIIPLMPNFYKELNNKQEYEDFLNPRYSPKLIVFIRDDEQIPIVMKQIAVAFFLKVDFAFVTDLTEEIIEEFKVKEYPSFVIIKYNFNESKHEYFPYEGDLQEENYHKIKKFVSQYSLKEERNDLVFHKIAIEPEAEIVTVETEGELQQVKQRASGWTIIVRSDGKIPQKLAQFHQKYNRYFSYVNYVHEPVGQMELYNPTENYTAPIPHGELEFNSLSAEDFNSNMTLWLHKDSIVLGVREDYAHICGLAEKTFFRGIVRCLVISKQDEEKLKQTMKIDFQIGFIVGMDKRGKAGKEPKGMKISQDDYEKIYRDLDYTTRQMMKWTLDQYIQNPINEVKTNMKISEACFHPFKKCLFLITNLEKKDRTLQQYVKDVAFDYMNNFILYEVDMDSNKELVQAIGGVKDKKADIIIYNPRTREYTKLNKKVTKNLISQFLKANLKNDKRLKTIKVEDFSEIIIKRRGQKRIQNEGDQL